MRYTLCKKSHGVTLIEVMLVLVVASMIIYMGLQYTIQKSEQNRIDKTVLQMQQILNAAQAYYVANGVWPMPPNDFATSTDFSRLSGYMTTAGVYLNPWGHPYYMRVHSAGNLFFVGTRIPGGTNTQVQARASIVAGQLPMAYTSTALPPSTSPCGSSLICMVIAGVNAPGPSLNQASGVTWMGLVRHGGCVPVPVCPVDQSGHTMVPRVAVVPVSVSGLNDVAGNVYPISSFSAYAMGPAGPTVTPDYCIGSWGRYGDCGVGTWRACARIITEKGTVAAMHPTTWYDMWGRYIVLLAMTRCASVSEPTGGGLGVYSN